MTLTRALAEAIAASADRTRAVDTAADAWAPVSAASVVMPSFAQGALAIERAEILVARGVGLHELRLGLRDHPARRLELRLMSARSISAMTRPCGRASLPRIEPGIRPPTFTPTSLLWRATT